MKRMRFILIWRVCGRCRTVNRRVIGILADLDSQVQDFINEGWHVVVLWKGVDRMIR